MRMVKLRVMNAVTIRHFSSMYLCIQPHAAHNTFTPLKRIHHNSHSSSFHSHSKKQNMTSQKTGR